MTGDGSGAPAAGCRWLREEAGELTHLVLFDVDGTLLTASGAGRRALERALAACFGVTGQLDGRELAGKSDPVIFREAALQLGVGLQQLQAGWEQLVERYLQFLDEELAHRQVRPLAGVACLLAHLKRCPDVVLGLGTGNLEQAAWRKLRAAGLESYFRVGGFGADGEDRAEILRAAFRRACSDSGAPYGVVVVGDTPLDVQAAHRAGFAAVAVATGPYSVEELQSSGPEAVLPDLACWAEAARVLLEAAARRPQVVQ
ncbi:MAG TPA: HAD family hydrolase [Limnochordales bacterium]